MWPYSLILEHLSLRQPDGLWPEPFELRLGLGEVLLIEGASAEDSQSLLDVAATLSEPAQGRVQLWGKEISTLTRQELYNLRRLIAYIHPRQALLHYLTVAENIGLGPAYHLGMTLSKTLRKHASLIEHLGLVPFLSRYPSEISQTVYSRALWARELVKLPELILAFWEESPGTAETERMMLTLLEDYLDKTGVSVMLAGPSLTAFHPLAHRIFKLEAGRIWERDLLEHEGRPLINYLPLV
jgi:ABC-type methionine transport system ATPase subunit